MNTIFGKLFGKRSTPEFHSQYGQDKWLFENLYKKKSNGFFIEIGADDGIDKSNSYFFERRMNWQGICIEPSPKRFELLKNNRQCICENYAIANSHGIADFMEISGWGKGLSGIIDNYNLRHRERIERELHHPENNGNEVIQVPTIPMRDLLKKHNIRHVDFCSIDTEGSELDIIQSIDFDQCQIDVLIIENNYNDPEVSRHLEKSGFTHVTKIEIDDIYFNEKFSP